MLLSRCLNKIIALVIASVFFHACSVSNNAYTGPSPHKTDSEAAVHFINVGQGDSALIALPDGENILIDAGGPAAGSVIAGYLKSNGINRIHHLVLTHPHDDHIGGVFSILSELEVDNVYDNGLGHVRGPVYRRYITSVRGNFSGYNVLRAGESLVFDKAKLEVLTPMAPFFGIPNEDSIAMRLIYGKIKIFFGADLGARGEKRLVDADKDLRSHVLKVGHHGDRDSCSVDFLSKVLPETAVISVGRGNKYGRPHRELLKRLGDIGAGIFRTDMNGHVILKTDGDTYSVHTGNE